MIRNDTINYYYIELKYYPIYSAVTTYEAIEVIALVKFVVTLKIAVHSLPFFL